MANQYTDIMVKYLPEWARSGQYCQRSIQWAQSVGQWFDEYPQTELVNLYKNINPDECPIEQIQLLADTIGLKITQDISTDEQFLRRQLKQAIDWYKLKGTHKSSKIIAYSVGVNINIIQLWSSDYSYFVRTERTWLDASVLGSSLSPKMDTGKRFDEGLFLDPFYPTPHLDVVMLGDHYETIEGIDYFIRTSDFNSISTRLDETFPALAVPHYYYELTALTDESKDLYIIPATNVRTLTTDKWIKDLPLLDAGFIMDDGIVFDRTPIVFLDGITSFKLGQGNVGGTINSTILDLADPVYSGVIQSRAYETDQVIFEIEVPDTVDISQVTEFGLYDVSLTSLYVAGVMPIVNKEEFALKITITIKYGSVL